MTDIEFKPGANGLDRAIIRTPLAEAHVYVQGAHVTHFQPRASKPLLFVSNSSWFEAGKPIRGGVPICFPWFALRKDDPKAPNHGFARTMDWKIAGFKSRDDGAATLEFSLTDTPATRAAWPHAFAARFSVTIGSSLEMSLEVTNRESEAFEFEEALHTYLSVSDVRNVKITGLTGAPWVDKMDGMKLKTQGPEPITFTGEVDRVYQNTQSTVIVDDPGFGRKISIAKSGSDSTVVWNPSIAKAAAMPDFGDDEWPGMVCVESCNVGEKAVKLLPGRSHRITAIVGLV